MPGTHSSLFGLLVIDEAKRFTILIPGDSASHVQLLQLYDVEEVPAVAALEVTLGREASQVLCLRARIQNPGLTTEPCQHPHRYGSILKLG